MKSENKKECAIVKDLYIVYDEAEISAESREFVEEHLENCQDCRQYYNEMNQSMQMVEDVKIDKGDTKKTDEEKKIKRSFRKIRRRWIASLLIVALLMPTFSVVYRLTKNQINGYGLRFTNMDDINLCKQYFEYIQEGKYEEAVSMMDYATDFFAEKYNHQAYIEGEYKKIQGTKIQLNQETWYVMAGTEYRIEDEEAFWKQAIENYQAGILIPEAIWKKYVPNPVTYKNYTYNVYYVNEEDMEKDFGSAHAFSRLKTKWGVFYVFDSSKSHKSTYYSRFGVETISSGFYFGRDTKITARLLCENCDFVPESVYLAANAEYETGKKNWEKQKEESEKNFNKCYGEIVEANEQEVAAYYVEKISARLKMFFDRGYKIVEISYSDDDQKRWVVTNREWYDSVEGITVVFEDSDKNQQAAWFFLGTKDGKLYEVGADFYESRGMAYAFYEMILYLDATNELDRLIEQEQKKK